VILTMKTEAMYSSEALLSTSKTIHYHNPDHILDFRSILNLINSFNVRGGKMWRVTAWLSMCNKHFTCKYTYKCILFESVICGFWSVAKELLPFAVVTITEEQQKFPECSVVWQLTVLVLGIFI
jgi:hypothetical protein